MCSIQRQVVEVVIKDFVFGENGIDSENGNSFGIDLGEMDQPETMVSLAGSQWIIVC